jgi:hypothetical protein
LIASPWLCTLDNVLCRQHAAYTTVFMSSVWLCLRAAGCLMHAWPVSLHVKRQDTRDKRCSMASVF